MDTKSATFTEGFKTLCIDYSSAVRAIIVNHGIPEYEPLQGVVEVSEELFAELEALSNFTAPP